MYLKKLEIQGFKSFAKKTVLEFEPGITSIVGPNGSGKSNIADSLRWVFGEQSMKLLRGKRAEDVIFAGSNSKARLGAAEVSIYFDNRDHKMAIEYDEVVVSRRVYRDGNSEYLINGNPVRLLDITELLTRSGFGNTSYYVIGQGTIDQLIARGPGAIKELVEEAAGILPYYQKRERALKKFDLTSVNLERARDLISEIEPRLRSLRRQTSRLEKRADLEKDLRENQLIFFSSTFRSLRLQAEGINSQMQTHEKQLAELSSEINDLQAGIDLQERKFETPQAYRKLQEDLDNLQKTKLAMQEELATIRGRVRAQSEEFSHKIDINWHEFKTKFRVAHIKLQALFKNYDPAQAQNALGLFEELAEMIKYAESPQAAEDHKRNLEKLVADEKRLTVDLEKLFAQVGEVNDHLAMYRKQEEELKNQVFVRERLLRNKQGLILKAMQSKNVLAVEQAKLLTRREAYEQEAREAFGANFAEALASVSETTNQLSAISEKIMHLKKQLEIIGGVDELVVKEYEETKNRYEYLSSQTHDLEKGMEDLKKVVAELDEVIKRDFHEAFVQISEKFSEYFRMLFDGGKATMTILKQQEQEEGVTDDSDMQITPSLSSPAKGGERAGVAGIEIRATPPGKKLATVSSLSGGERALTSIALLSAILGTYPTPFVALDEVDAALDEANSIRFGKILGTLAHKTQFITITHNRETMRQSHTLYGVTMGDDGVSKVLGLKLEQAAAYSTKN